MRLTREQIEAWRKHWSNASALDEDSVGAHSDELAELNKLCDLALLGLAQEQNNAAPSIHVGTATTDLSQPRTWNAENVQVYFPAAPDAAPQDRTSDEQPSQLAGPAAAAPVDRPTPRTDAFYKEHPICEYETFADGDDCDAWLDYARQLERELAEVDQLRRDQVSSMLATERSDAKRIAELEAKIARMRPSYEALEAAIHYQNKMRVPDATGILARELLRISEEAKIERMRPSEEAVKCAEQVITAERNAFPPIKGAKWGVGFLALTILRINEEAK